MHKTVKILSILALLCCRLALLLVENKTPPKDNDTGTSSNTVFLLKLVDNNLYLYESNVILKSYDINPVVLPGEDILMLSNGVEVKNIAEADSIVENFDG